MDASINQRLKDFLYKKKISQENLRVNLGIKSKQQVNSWVNGHVHIPEKHLIAIINLFPDMNANWLLRNVGSPLIDQQQLRQVNRNAFGFCEECLTKDKKIESLQELINDKDRKLNEKDDRLTEAWRIIGRLEKENEYRHCSAILPQSDKKNAENKE